jgi:biopolymer transport protein ExbB
MLEEILRGGIINIILLIAYFFVCLVVLERWIFFIITAGSFKKFSNILFALLSKSNINFENNLKNKDLLKFQKTAYYVFTEAYIKNINKPSIVQKEELSKTGEKIISGMESSIWILSLLGHLSPLMGLLGTMTGLIKSFKTIELMGGNVDISILSGGIWEAMMTTVMGLIVAIMAFFFQRIFDHLIDKRTKKLDLLLSELNARFLNKITLNPQVCYKNQDKQGIDDDIS